jgi:hypothetical protein
MTIKFRAQPFSKYLDAVVDSTFATGVGTSQGRKPDLRWQSLPMCILTSLMRVMKITINLLLVFFCPLSSLQTYDSIALIRRTVSLHA